MGLPLLFNGHATYTQVGSGGLWVGTSSLYNRVSSFTGSGGAYENGTAPIKTISNASVASAGALVAGLAVANEIDNVSVSAVGGWANGAASQTAIFNVFLPAVGVWVSDPTRGQPTEYVPTLLGESSFGLQCQFGLDLRTVSMVQINKAYIPAVTVCNQQITLRRLLQRMQ